MLHFVTVGIYKQEKNVHCVHQFQNVYILSSRTCGADSTSMNIMYYFSLLIRV